MLQSDMDTILYIKIFLATTVTTLIFDFIWLGVIAKNLYISEIGSLLRKSSQGGMAPLIVPTVLVYIVIPLAIVLFAVPKALGKPLPEAFLWGALLGFFLYAVYDLTNLATLNNWSVKVVIIDMIWGAFLCGSVTAIISRIFSS